MLSINSYYWSYVGSCVTCTNLLSSKHKTRVQFSIIVGNDSCSSYLHAKNAEDMTEITLHPYN